MLGPRKSFDPIPENPLAVLWIRVEGHLLDKQARTYLEVLAHTSCSSFIHITAHGAYPLRAESVTLILSYT